MAFKSSVDCAAEHLFTIKSNPALCPDFLPKERGKRQIGPVTAAITKGHTTQPKQKEKKRGNRLVGPITAEKTAGINKRRVNVNAKMQLQFDQHHTNSKKVRDTVCPS